MSCRLQARQARKGLTEQEKPQGKAARLSIMTQDSFHNEEEKGKVHLHYPEEGNVSRMSTSPRNLDCRFFVRRRRDATHFSGSCGVPLTATLRRPEERVAPCSLCTGLLPQILLEASRKVVGTHHQPSDPPSRFLQPSCRWRCSFSAVQDTPKLGVSGDFGQVGHSAPVLPGHCSSLWQACLELFFTSSNGEVRW